MANATIRPTSSTTPEPNEKCYSVVSSRFLFYFCVFACSHISHINRRLTIGSMCVFVFISVDMMGSFVL